MIVRPQVWRWIAAGALLLAFFWFANLTLYNWWAAGGPPTPHPERYAARATAFLVVSGLLLIAIGVLIWMNVREARR
jgi:hypothetical protein